MRSEPKDWRPRFFTIWIGQTLSMIGSNLGSFAIVWWLTTTTGSAAVLATSSLAAFAPRILLSPLAGILVDRWKRKWVIAGSDAFIALVSLGLACLSWAGVLEIWHIYAAAVLRSIGAALHSPAMHASTSLLVPEKHLSRVSGLNITLGGTLGLAGPMLGALAISFLPRHGVMLIDVITAAFAIGPVLWFSIPQPKRAPLLQRDTLWRNLVEAGRYLRTVPGFLVLLLVCLTANFFVSPINTYMPLYITEHFKGGAFHLAALEAGSGIGAIAGGLLFALWTGFRRKTTTILVSMALQGVGLLIVAAAPTSAILVAVGGMIFAAIVCTYSNAPVEPLLQMNVQPDRKSVV
jgi:DHA3 family macrolide efflux protein-like MFS transporter